MIGYHISVDLSPCARAWQQLLSTYDKVFLSKMIVSDGLISNIVLPMRLLPTDVNSILSSALLICDGFLCCHNELWLSTGECKRVCISFFQGVHSFLINKKQKKKAHILANPLSLLRQTKKNKTKNSKQKITAIHMLISFIEKKKKTHTHTNVNISSNENNVDEHLTIKFYISHIEDDHLKIKLYIYRIHIVTI